MTIAAAFNSLIAVTPHNPLDWIDRELSELDDLHLLRRRATRQGAQSGAEIVLDGQPLINFSSNDYLALAADERLRAAVAQSVQQSGWGSGASPAVTGRASQHDQLEQSLAKFEATQAALLFPSGYAANVATVAELAGRGDVIFSDAKNHASIIDGCRLSTAETRVYPHGDAQSLAAMLLQASGYRRRLIVTDTLFSMDGDFAPLRMLIDLAQRHQAMLMVDEAHATGVFGAHGRGVAELLGVEEGIHARVGTLSKALGSVGGFVVGQKNLIDFLANRARSYVFSTALPEATAAASLAAIKIVQEEPERRLVLLQRAESLREELRRQGWLLGESCSQIVPLMVGDPAAALSLSAALRQRGLLAPCIRPPSVPQGQSLLRIGLSYAHDEQEVELLVDALRKLRTTSP